MIQKSIIEMDEAIKYMEKRITVSQVNKVTDNILLRVCKAVKILLEAEAKRNENNA